MKLTHLLKPTFEYTLKANQKPSLVRDLSSFIYALGSLSWPSKESEFSSNNISFVNQN